MATHIRKYYDYLADSMKPQLHEKYMNTVIWVFTGIKEHTHVHA